MYSDVCLAVISILKSGFYIFWPKKTDVLANILCITWLRTYYVRWRNNPEGPAAEGLSQVL